jgi:hypothetical protein
MTRPGCHILKTKNERRRMCTNQWKESLKARCSTMRAERWRGRESPREGNNLAYDTTKWCACSQILDQILNTAQMPAKQRLLLLRGSCSLAVTIGPFPACGISIERPSELTRTALKHCGYGSPSIGSGDRWHFGHQVEVQELNELELHISGCRSRLEERGNSQQTIQILECAGIFRSVNQGDYQSEQGCRLDGRAVDGLKKVEEKLLVAS